MNRDDLTLGCPVTVRVKVGSATRRAIIVGLGHNSARVKVSNNTTCIVNYQDIIERHLSASGVEKMTNKIEELEIL